MTASIDLLLQDLAELQKAIAAQASEYRLTPMIGRSHGIHAEPITFGLKLGLMYDEFSRAIERLQQTRCRVAVGKLWPTWEKFIATGQKYVSKLTAAEKKSGKGFIDDAGSIYAAVMNQ